ncbi:MAG: AAA family ATPase [bacterium]|nr:AAA family ATPase [bacterium]
MVSITGHEIVEKLYESQNSTVYRARRKEDAQAVILKVLGSEYPTPEQVARFRREFEITRNLDHDGAIQAFSLLKSGNQPVIALEDFGGESLIRVLLARKIETREFLSLAIRVTELLASIHRRNIIHKDINPSNIVWNQTSDEVKLIDYGISTTLSKESPEVRNPEVLEGTLAYMSPEQTGRMNRAMDYRTDLYSLGVTFFRMLSGRLPFESDDPMELVHCHIARVAPELRELAPEVPPVICSIVSKLMSKTAEDRYQSAVGLRVDLERCLEQLDENGVIEDFAIGQRDASDRFQIPQKLYGREQEVRTLLDAFGRVSQGATEMMLVTGFSGAGKSALVHEIQKPLVESRGYFIHGKFDQLNRSKPYASLIQAFQELVRQLLTESEKQVTVWREKILEGLRSNGQIIIDVIPEVELIIGPQEAVPELPPVESQNRFHLVFQTFVETFAGRDHPLALFLDDLQWADLPSLKLIEQIMTDPSMKFMFLIGAYRSNEVGEAHPVHLTLGKIREAGTVISTVELQPLSQEYVRQLVCETLKQDSEATRPMADLCYERTGGNPFFLNQFLTALYEDRLIEFDAERICWRWDIDVIHRRGMTDNVIDLMTEKLKRLSNETQSVLKLAACIGNVFDLGTLSVVYEQDKARTADGLWEALQEGLVIPVDNSFKFVLDLEPHQVLYRFLHDRVQQAAYTLIQPAQVAALHLRIGRLLLERSARDHNEQEKIFDIVGHLNQGREMIDSPDERERLAELNLIAGKKAKFSAAYALAYQYLSTGVELLGEGSWKDNYVLTLNLMTEAAEAAYLSADFGAMEGLAEAVLKNAKTLLHRLRVHEIRIQALTARNQPGEAIHTALLVLKPLGVSFPERPGQLNILIELVKTKFALRGRKAATLDELPEMTDQYKLGAMRILASVAVAAYTIRPELFVLTAFKQIQLSLKYGNTSLSSFGYATYGFILCGVTGEIDQGYEFGRLAIRILDRFNARELYARTLLAVNSLGRHWKDHYRESLDPSLEGYQRGLETGDLEYASYNAVMYCYISWLMGRELAGVSEDIGKYRAVVVQFRQQTPLYWHSIVQQTVENITADGPLSSELIGEFYDETSSEAVHVEVKDYTTLFTLYFNKMLLAYLAGDYRTAFQQSQKANAVKDGAVATPMIVPYYYYYSLVLLAMLRSGVNEFSRGKTLRKVRGNQRKLKRWASFAPQNNLHKWHLVQAELDSMRGKDSSAMSHYRLAASMAKTHDYLNDEAVANELIGRFYEGRGEHKIARLFIEESVYYYRKWGAQAKINQLESIYSFLGPRGPAEQVTTSTFGQTTSGTSSEHQGRLDITTVMKGSLAISGEIVLEKLLSRLIRIVIENAGAERGYLIMETDGELCVQAEGSAQSAGAKVDQRTPLESLATSIIYYVVRTREDVVLDDAGYDARFNKDPSVRRNRTKSVLCTPIVQAGRLLGVLYLENNLTTGAFTENRVQVLRLLAAQAAVSLGNALLYENLELQVQDRTKELNATLDTIKQDLATAQKIQASIMPQGDEIGGVRFHAKYLPMAEVGGDFYDVTEIAEGVIRVIVADATGHGIQAALMTMAIKGAYENFKTASANPSDLLFELNNDFNRKYYSLNSYFTAIIVDIDLNQGRLTYASAGHPDQVLITEEGIRYLPHTGSMIGILPDLPYKSASMPFSPADRLLLFTDGVFEQFNEQIEEYGEERLMRRITELQGESASLIIEQILDDVENFLEETPPQDDIVMLGIESNR